MKPQFSPDMCFPRPVARFGLDEYYGTSSTYYRYYTKVGTVPYGVLRTSGVAIGDVIIQRSSCMFRRCKVRCTACDSS